jgi:protein TonB
MTCIAVSTRVKNPKVYRDTTIQPKGKYMVKDQDVSFKQTKAITAKQQKSLLTAAGLVISLLMVIAAFEWKSYEQEELVNLGTLDAEFEEILDIPVTQQEPPPTLQEIVPPEIIEVPDEEEIEEEIEVNLDIEVTEETVIEEVVFDEAPEEEVTEEIFDIVEEQASPVGGYEGIL